MLYSTATTILLCLSSTLLSIAAPIPHEIRAAKKTLPDTETGGTKPGGSGSGLIFPASVNDDGKAFGVKGKFKTGTSELRKQGDSTVLVGKYPKGSYAGAKIAGFIFSADGGADLDNAQEATLNYQIQFPEGFDFALAGKIPGLFGGDNEKVAGSCAGGHHDDQCWSARLMWRDGGKGELYGYLPTPNQRLAICKGKCDVKYGASLGTGAWKFKPGKWAQLTERVKLNDVGKSNGEIEVSVDGESKIHVKNLTLRTKEAGRIRGAMIHTFFGGSSSPSFASPKSQEALFKDFSLEVTKTFGGGKPEGGDSDDKKGTTPKKGGDDKGDDN